MGKLLASCAVLVLLFAAALHLPAQVRLELHDVNDLTYDLPDFPTVDISLATRIPVDPILCLDLMMSGEDLANRLRVLLPGRETLVQFQNGLLIVRGTAAQRFAVRAALAAHRARNHFADVGIYGISRAKAALSARLFGMITR